MLQKTFGSSSRKLDEKEKKKKKLEWQLEKLVTLNANAIRNRNAKIYAKLVQIQIANIL